MADRIRLKLDSGLAGLLGPEHLRQLEGVWVPFRSGEENVAARVEEVEFGETGFFVTLVIDDMPPGQCVVAPVGRIS